MKLLHLDSSINGAESASRTLSAAVVAQLTSADPDIEVVYRDLAAEPVDHLTLATRVGDESNEMLAEFLSADIVVIGAGLYNFTIPGQLKAWLDRILIAGRTFRYSAAGPEGLAGDKRVIVALARGNVYSEGSPYAAFEHGESLLRVTLGFIGITAPEFIIAEGLAISPETRQAAFDGAMEKARQLELRAIAR